MARAYQGLLAAAVAVVGLQVGCAGAANPARTDGGNDAAQETTPRTFRCETSPPSSWQPVWDVAITNQKTPGLFLAANRSGELQAVLLPVLAPDSTVIEAHDASGALSWRVPLGIISWSMSLIVAGNAALAVGPGGEVFVVVAGSIGSVSGILGDAAARGETGKATLIRLEADGTLGWVTPVVAAEAAPVRPPGGLRRTALALDGLGNVWVAVTFYVPGDERSSYENLVTSVVTILEQHDSAGRLLLQKTFTARPNAPFSPFQFEDYVSLAADRNGGVALAGATAGTIDLGGGAMTPIGRVNLYVGRFDPTGQHLWSAVFGGDQKSFPEGLTVDSQENVIVSGSFEGLLDFGDVLLGGHGLLDGFIAKIAPDGTLRWARNFGEGAQNRGGRIAVDTMGTVRFTVSNQRLTFPDGKQLDSTGVSAMLVLDQTGTVLEPRCFPARYVADVAGDDVGDVFLLSWVGIEESSLVGARLSRLPP